MTAITKPFSPATSRRIAVAMFAAGVLLLCSAIHLFVRQWEFNSHAVRTTGVAKVVNPPEIVFQTQEGDSITFTHDGWRSGGYPSAVGETVRVAYLPDAPARAEIADFIWLAPGITAFTSAVLMLLSYLTFVGKVVIGPLKQNSFVMGGD
ncbi:MAG: hypothetical protein RI907_913 [Pseudomonadota bacterium]|jgi:hypothetical protein